MVTIEKVEGPGLVPTEIADEIAAAAARHERRLHPRLTTFIRQSEERYAEEIRGFSERYRSGLALRPYTDSIVEEVADYLYWLRWVGWNAANLLALADFDEELPGDFGRHMLAYSALRLVDDGLDGHRTYKGARRTLVAFLEEVRGPVARRSEAYSAFLGMCIFDFARQRIAESSPESSASVSRLFDRAAGGVLAEGAAETIEEADVYEQIARRKAGAYNLILYLPFLRALDWPERQPLVATLVEMDVVAQVINDMRDQSDDQRMRQPTAVDVYTNAGLQDEVTRRITALWESASFLPSDRRDALAAMFGNLDPELFASSRLTA